MLTGVESVYTDTLSHAHFFSAVVVVVLRHTFDALRTSQHFRCKVEMKSHSIKSSDAH